MHVDRNWFALPSDPVGTVVTRVHREKTADHQPVTYGLETSGPPVPFRIDPQTGVVYVNDTLTDKVNIYLEPGVAWGLWLDLLRSKPATLKARHIRCCAIEYEPPDTYAIQHASFLY